MKLKLILSLIVILTILACVTTFHPKKPKDYKLVTGLVEDYDRSGGGTTVLYKSSKNGSLFWTNKHVCINLLDGGRILLNNEAYDVKELLFYKDHDLCMLKIKENLKLDLVLAKSAPQEYDEVTAVGYPLLKGPIISKGYIVNSEMILHGSPLDMCYPLDTLFYRCEENKKKFDELSSTFVAIFVTFGSSGSPLFNTAGELVGLVMAKDKEAGFSYGYAVPLNYLKDFASQINNNTKFILIPGRKK